MKKIIGFSKRGIRALLLPVAGYLVLQIILDAFARISFSFLPENATLNKLLNVLLWFSITAAIGYLIGNPTLRKTAFRLVDPVESPRFYIFVKFLLGNDEEQDAKYPEVLFELVPGDWKVGIQMSTLTILTDGTPTKWCIIMEPSAPVPFTGALHFRKTSDVTLTGKNFQNTALTALSLGTKYNIDPDFKLRTTKKDA